MAVRPGNDEPVHRAWLSLGKRLVRVLQRQAQGRMIERRDLLQPEGGPDGHRKLAQSLQYQAPTFCARISATGTAHHRANARPDSQYELVSQLSWYKISVRPMAPCSNRMPTAEPAFPKGAIVMLRSFTTMFAPLTTIPVGEPSVA